MIVLWLCFLLFLVLTISFFRGKGSFLVAGYNTLSPEEKDRYDEKKLMRVMGCCMGVCCLGILFMILFLEKYTRVVSFIFIALVLSDVVVTMILTNTICRKPSGKTDIGNHDSKANVDGEKRSRKISWIACGCALLISGLILCTLITGNVEVRLEEDRLDIVCSYWPDQSIDYSRIEAVSYSEDWDPGKRISGFGSFRLNLGRFENSRVGRYYLYAYTDCSSFIIINTDEGIVAVNGKDEVSTGKLYERIQERLQSYYLQ